MTFITKGLARALKHIEPLEGHALYGDARKAVLSAYAADGEVYAVAKAKVIRAAFRDTVEFEKGFAA